MITIPPGSIFSKENSIENRIRKLVKWHNDQENELLDGALYVQLIQAWNEVYRLTTKHPEHFRLYLKLKDYSLKLYEFEYTHNFTDYRKGIAWYKKRIVERSVYPKINE